MANLVTLSRSEYLDDIPFVANSTQTRASKGGTLDNDRFIAKLLLEVEGRIAIGVADCTAEYPGSPYNIIEEVRVSGYHRINKRNEMRLQVRAEDLRQKALIYGMRAPYSTGAMGVAQGNKDFRFFLPISFVPQGVPLEQQAAYLLDAPNFDKLTLEVQWGDANSCFTKAGTTTFTYTAFGSAAGAPRARLYATFASFGPGAGQGLIPAALWQYYQENISSDITGGKNGARVRNLDAGNQIRSLLIKSGVKIAGTGNNNVYASLSDTILSNISINLGTNKSITSFADFRGLKEVNAQERRIFADVGYGLIDWCGREDMRTILDTSSFVGQPAADVDLFLKSDVAGGAGQAVLTLIEEVRGVPVGF